MERRAAAAIGLVAGSAAAAWAGTWLYRRLGLGFWFLVLIVPVCIGTLQGVASLVARILGGVDRR
jgi:hypothetical protein